MPDGADVPGRIVGGKRTRCLTLTYQLIFTKYGVTDAVYHPKIDGGKCSGRKRPSKSVFGGHLFLPKGTGTSRNLSNS